MLYIIKNYKGTYKSTSCIPTHQTTDFYNNKYYKLKEKEVRKKEIKNELEVKEYEYKKKKISSHDGTIC